MQNQRLKRYLAIMFSTVLIISSANVFGDTNDENGEVMKGNNDITLTCKSDVDKKEAMQNERITIGYKFQTLLNQLNSKLMKPLEVVLIIDESSIGSDKNRGDYIKESAKAFVDKLCESSLPSGSKIGIAAYDKYSYKLGDSLSIRDSKDIQDLENQIDKINFYGDSNLQEGILTAADMFSNDDSDKYAVVITGKIPNYYTSGWQNKVFEQEKSYNNWQTPFGVARNKSNSSLQQAFASIDDLFMTKGIKTYAIGVKNGDDSYKNYIKELAEYGHGKFSIAEDSSNIEERLEALANDIVGGKSITGIKFSQEIPEAFDVKKLPDGWSFNDDTRMINGVIGDINLDTKNNKKDYSNSIEISAHVDGDYDMPSAYIDYDTLSNSQSISVDVDKIKILKSSINNKPELSIISPRNGSKLDQNYNMIPLTFKNIDSDTFDATLINKISVDSEGDGNYTPITSIYVDEDGDGVAEAYKKIGDGGIELQTEKVINAAIPKTFSDQRIVKVKMECIDSKDENDEKEIVLVNGNNPINVPTIKEAEILPSAGLDMKQGEQKDIQLKFKLAKACKNAQIYLTTDDVTSKFEIKSASFDQGEACSFDSVQKMINVGDIEANKEYIINVKLKGSNLSIGTPQQKDTINGVINFDRIKCNYIGVDCNIFIIGKSIHYVIRSKPVIKLK